MNWPQSWGPPQHRSFPRASINCIVLDEPPTAGLSAAYAADGIAVTTLKDPGIVLAPGSKWPQVQTGGNTGTDAGPTGVPWVNANGYLVQLTRALNPGKPVWLDYGAPRENSVLTADMLRLAVCDAAAYGGRWVMRPSTDNLPALIKTADFFVRRQSWQAYRPIANLAVVADFAGANRTLAVETLNLLARRLVPFVINPADLSGFAAVLWMRAKAAPKTTGILIQPQSDDPFQVAIDTHQQMGRRHDLMRLWNDGSMNAYYSAAQDDREHLVQLINYSAAEASDAITLGLARSYQSAVLTTLDGEPKPLAVHAVRAGVELQLPPFPVYAAISLRL